MAYFVISYDLMAQKNYKRLTDALIALGSARVALSVWLVERHQTNAFSLRDYLAGYIDDDDKLVVIEFSLKPAWRRALPEGAKWIEERFP